MYFNKLGTTEYNGITIPDFLRRVSVTGNVSVSNLVDQYTIIEGESPESLSFNYYGTVDYYWTIMILNNIKSRYFDWPLSSQDLGSYITNKHGNKSALFFAESQLDNYVNLCDSAYVQTINNKKYKVISCDRNLNKIVIEKIEPQDLLVGGIVNLLDTKLNFLSGLIVNRIVYENEYSVHHFVDGENYTRQHLTAYINGQGEEYAVTNTTYEIEENEKKRNIFLIRPQFISSFVQQFKQIARA